ncbi:transcription factor bHLH128-like isoform X1 [Panicum virgatum]|uniref:BHLH domain-containing protein n=1 Tax=Panicum virgatum TaxID=38727 RepID=A0A8T0X4B4_PANVG|nr:transcription factor bHLH128-like isoform X1 [Panicum virgatum]KAG2652163.1 hypothetical protein PVAP13_1NG340000 [Panicum virgatum]
MRRFLPVGGGGGGEPSSSSSSGERAGERAAAAGLRYGGGDISRGHGHGHGGGGGDAAERQQDGSMDMLARHSSSPAGFFSNLMVDNGYPSGGSSGGGAEAHHPSTASGSGGGRRMKPSRLNFTRPPQQAGGAAGGHLSQISEDGAFPASLVGGDRAGESSGGAARSFSGGFSIVGPWEESRDIIATLSAYDSQYSGAMAGTALEMAAGMDRYMQLQQDQVPFKVRAKRGCATHPRSIAERERRTRISEKLRKLQELVPNMDKQTSTADMLDLAIEHIKGLQSELQALKHEQEKCTCCRKR